MSKIIISIIALLNFSLTVQYIVMYFKGRTHMQNREIVPALKIWFEKRQRAMLKQIIVMSLNLIVILMFLLSVFHVITF